MVRGAKCFTALGGICFGAIPSALCIRSNLSASSSWPWLMRAGDPGTGDLERSGLANIQMEPTRHSFAW